MAYFESRQPSAVSRAALLFEDLLLPLPLPDELLTYGCA